MFKWRNNFWAARHDPIIGMSWLHKLSLFNGNDSLNIFPSWNLPGNGRGNPSTEIKEWNNITADHTNPEDEWHKSTSAGHTNPSVLSSQQLVAITGLLCLSVSNKSVFPKVWKLSASKINSYKMNTYSTKRIVSIVLIGIEERGSLLSTISLFLWGTVGPPLASRTIPSLLEAHHGRPWLTILPPPFYRPPMYSGGLEQDTETNCNEVKEKDKNAPRGRLGGGGDDEKRILRTTSAPFQSCLRKVWISQPIDASTSNT